MKRLFALLFAPAIAVAAPASREQIADLVRGHHWAAAVPLLEQAVAATPGDAEAHFYLGEALLNQGKEEPAVAELEKATALQPGTSSYFALLGDAYGTCAQKAGIFSKPGWARKCKAAYEKAVALDPNDLGAHQGLMQYCLEAPGFLGGGMDHAYAQAAEIKRIDAAQGRVAYGMLYLHEKKYPEAFAQYDEVLKTAPDDYMALYQFGRLAAISGKNLDRGLTALRRCLDLAPPEGAPGRAPTQWRIGNILEKLGDKTGARSAYQTALQLDAGFKEARESLSRL